MHLTARYVVTSTPLVFKTYHASYGIDKRLLLLLARLQGAKSVDALCRHCYTRCHECIRVVNI
jgi:hypothetical protein